MFPSQSNLALQERGHSPMLEMDMETDAIILETRFGRIAVERSAVIRMPQGPHGFGSHRAFALLNIPGAEEQPFKLYQSLDDDQLSFIVLPLPESDSEGGSPIAEADLTEACRSYGVARENAAFLLIVTMRRDEAGQVAMTANLRAPLLVDTVQRTARQHIFVSSDYPTRQTL